MLYIQKLKCYIFKNLQKRQTSGELFQAILCGNRTRYNYVNTVSYIYCDFYGCKNVNIQMKHKDIYLYFAQNIDCGYFLETPCIIVDAVLTSSHNPCFRAKKKE